MYLTLAGITVGRLYLQCIHVTATMINHLTICSSLSNGSNVVIAPRFQTKNFRERMSKNLETWDIEFGGGGEQPRCNLSRIKTNVVSW